MTKPAITFSESTIEEFKDCFLLYAREGYVASSGQLLLIMRSLGYSATKLESASYFSQFSDKDTDRLDFPNFIQVMAKHKKSVDARGDVLTCFKAGDTKSTGVISVEDLTALLQSSGEQLHQTEITRFFRDAGLEQPANSGGGTKMTSGSESQTKQQLVDYNKLLAFLLSPSLSTTGSAKTSASGNIWGGGKPRNGSRR